MKIVLFLFLSLMVLPFNAYASDEEDASFDAMAKELLQKLENTAQWQMDKYLSMVGMGEAKSVAVWPFKEDEIPVPKSVADRWTKLLESALVRHKQTTLRVVTRSNLATLVEEAQGMAAFEDVGNPVSMLARNAKVSALVIGTITPYKGGYKLSFNAQEVQTGSIIAASQEYEFSADIEEASRQEQALTFDAAMKQAARHFAQSNLPLETMEVYGVREARSQAMTRFGQFVTDRVSLDLSEEIARFMPDFRLKVVDADEYAPNATRGASQVEEEGQVDPHRFVFEGHYWQLGSLVDLRLSLKGETGERAAWTGKIKTETIPATLLDYAPEYAYSGRNDTGPIGLTLKSNKGRNPAFKTGENVILWVATERDAYVNCFYKQADGIGFKIFPNHFLQADASVKNAEAGFVKGGQPVEIPGTYASGFKFTASPPAGNEEIHCFATDQDISTQLPAEIGMKSLEPLPRQQLSRLSNIYRNVRGVRLSEASMMLTIHE